MLTAVSGFVIDAILVALKIGPRVVETKPRRVARAVGRSWTRIPEAAALILICTIGAFEVPVCVTWTGAADGTALSIRSWIRVIKLVVSRYSSSPITMVVSL